MERHDLKTSHNAGKQRKIALSFFASIAITIFVYLFHFVVSENFSENISTQSLNNFTFYMFIFLNIVSAVAIHVMRTED